MREFTLIIKRNEKGGQLFEGEAVLKILPYKERLGLLKGINLNMDNSGGLKMDGTQIDAAIKFAEITEKYTKSICVSKKDGTKYEKLEDLQYDADATQIMTEIANQIVAGIKTTKPKE